VSIGKHKPKLSGAQRRKLQKQKQQLADAPRDGELLARIRMGHFDHGGTVNQWRIELARVYRAMRLGHLRTDEGTKLTYVANVAAQLAKMAEELRELEALRQQLSRVQGTAPVGLITSDADGGELIPARRNGEDV
jgi:hypothetical protein